MRPLTGVFSPPAIKTSCLKRAFAAAEEFLNAPEESIDREKKFPTFAPKLVQIATTVGQFSASFDIVAQSF
jgi:hypothetical protein